MPVVLTAIADLDVPLPGGPGQHGLAHAPTAASIAPVFTEPFPVDPAGLLFDGSVSGCFGVWHGIEPARRARLSRQVRVLRWHGPDDLVIELLPADATVRVVLARNPAPTTLAAAADDVARTVRRADGPLGRWLRPRTLGEADGLRLPVVDAVIGERDPARARIALGGDGPTEPVPEALTLGRGDAYRRLLAVDGPFLLWVGARGSTSPRLVAWITEV